MKMSLFFNDGIRRPYIFVGSLHSMMIISYKEFLPSVALQPYVENYWYQVFDGDAAEDSPAQVCLPLGMVQIIIHVYQQDCRVLVDGNWQKLPDAFFVGIYKDAVTWRTKGCSVCFGVNLKPEIFARLFNVPAAALFNDYTDIGNLMNAGITEMAERMYGVTNAAELILIAESSLLQRIGHSRQRGHYLDQAASIIRESKGNISIESLCKDLYVSERQLQRSFRDVLGTSPKTYTRIIRFRNVYRHVRHSAEKKISWASLSYDYGYADQAHFIRDFKEFSGVNPTLIEKNGAFYQLSTSIYSNKYTTTSSITE
ncbi:helix-turn-helix transcriptional regulator [Paraflavitalea sp. CAU 1676]|uniref:helix-turn-helix transcriptional regulator n=1 Tax=Paraflavitalea sp. CAU 1676 TaxID=3032598 RepID=UPI0023DB1B71|nr:helix-turn-helix transcriptional regulator [Paraflavitalea sp. CAU 1676]MDF2191455.1 helix-turn-helix transcriptional regulator [Paraflavitalea sp. CAU 1676]